MYWEHEETRECLGGYKVIYRHTQSEYTKFTVEAMTKDEAERIGKTLSESYNSFFKFLFS